MTMADADRHDASKSVEIASALLIEHILAAALDDHDRLFVQGEYRRVDKFFAQRENLVGRGSGVGSW